LAFDESLFGLCGHAGEPVGAIIRDAAQNVTTYAYDLENNLTSITDAARPTPALDFREETRKSRHVRS
jgi:YD repeat-containing protein